MDNFKNATLRLEMCILMYHINITFPIEKAVGGITET